MPDDALLLCASPLLLCALLCHPLAVHSVTLRSFASATHCFTLPCRCFSGRIKATHFDAQPSRVTASQYFAFTMRNISQLLHFSATPVSTFPLRCRDTHRPAKPSPLFTSQNRTQPGLCNSRPSGALPLRCYASPYSAFPLLRNAQLSCAVAVLFNSLPFRCCA